MKLALAMLAAALALAGCGHPGQVKVVSFSGRLPASKTTGPLVSRFSPAFHTDGGTVRAVGVLTIGSQTQGGLRGLSLWVQKRTAGGRWVDAEDGEMNPRGPYSWSGSSMVFDWATTALLKPVVYRVAIDGGEVGEKYSAAVYAER